jgi:putative salt-induced outer membrane protein YdiY
MMRAVCFAVLAALTFETAVFAEDEAPKRPWSDAAELGVVMTSGNSEGVNFAASNKFKYTWSSSELICDAAALRAESRTRDITKRFYWFAGAAWTQNFFAGVDDRYIVGGGLGYTFVKTDRHLFKGEIGADYTREDPLGNPPPVELETAEFAGLLGSLSYEFKFGEKSKLTEDLVFFENLETSNAWRANSVTALTTSLTKSLALKVSYRIDYSNEPLLKVVDPDPVPPPPPGAAPALYQFESTDTILTVALVVNF